MSQHRDLSLKDVSSRFWTKLDESLHDQLDNVVIALSKEAGDKCHEYRLDEVEEFKQKPDPVRRLLLDWADEKKATIGDLENFLARSRGFGEQPLKLLRQYCGECVKSSRQVGACSGRPLSYSHPDRNSRPGRMGLGARLLTGHSTLLAS